MEKKKNRVTVTILAYNTVYLREALCAVMQQTYKDINIIVRDDRLSDEIEEITKSFSVMDKRVSYVRNERNLKEMRSWKEAVKACETEFLLATHDDDIMDSNLVEKLLEAMERDSDMVQVSCRVRRIDENGQEVYRGRQLEQDLVFDINEYALYLCENPISVINTPTVMIRTQPIKQMISDGDFDGRLVGDLNRHLIINEKGKIHILKDVLHSYRIHKDQRSYCYKPEHYDMKRFGVPIMENLYGAESTKAYRMHVLLRRWDAELYQSIKTIYERDKTLYDVGDYIPLHFKSLIMRLIYLSEKEKGTKRNCVIWGASSAGIATCEILRKNAKNFEIKGFIDKSKKGLVCGLPVFSPEEYDFKSGNYIFVSVSNFGYWIIMDLIEMGFKIEKDFMPGYGISSFLGVL